MLEQLIKTTVTSKAIHINQHDTFFNCNNGRLKLRDFGEDRDSNSCELDSGELDSSELDRGELIFYQRADEAGPKESYYLITKIAEPGLLKQTLGQAYGIKGEVKKRRILYLTGRTRIHLDQVEGLGDFLELEVMLTEGETLEAGIEEANSLIAKLGLSNAPFIQGAYVDLLQQATNQSLV